MTSPKRLSLVLGDAVAGHVSRLQSGRLSFEYLHEYTTDPSATPVSLSMPVQVRSHPDRTITPWLAGLLPDNDAVLTRWSREFHVSATPFSLLATRLGEDCPGAVRLLPEDRVHDDESGTGSAAIEWLTEAAVAQRLRDLKVDHTAWLGARGQGRFSLAGAQAKTALVFENGRWGDPHGDKATTHLLKPAIEGLDEHDLNEHLCLSAMRTAGLRAVRTSVARFEDQSAIVVRRYDRVDHDGVQLRLHQEDLCQATGTHPSRKYQNEGGPTPADIATLFTRVMPRPAAQEAVLAFLDALIWNWVIAGTDAHAKNYSLLLLANQVRLAPFYDVASALPYDLPRQKMRLAMKFGSSYRLDPVGPPWTRIGADLQLSEDQVRERAASIIEKVPDAFSTAASADAVLELTSDLPHRLVDLVSARAVVCRGYLGAP